MSLAFSARVREDLIRQLETMPVDLLVIGGGITGAGIALDAASRGLRVGLLEKNDFAFGTSSRSTKLIHGGLRYLKQLEFGLVKEVGSERAIVHRLAPHLVVPEKMLLPLYEKKGLGYWLTSIGLKIYDLLAGVKPEDQRRMLTRNQTLRQEPLLKPEDVKGGAIYAEYRTDDARLTIEIIKTAHEKGAIIVSYCQVTNFIYESEKIAGVQVADPITGNSFAVRSKVVVNAAGPWVDELRAIDHSKDAQIADKVGPARPYDKVGQARLNDGVGQARPYDKVGQARLNDGVGQARPYDKVGQGKRLHLTKGVHLVVSYDRFPIKQAIYFDVDDGRMIFAIPRGRTTYLGTTDTNYNESKDEVIANHEDAVYLINAVNRTFPAANLSLKDVESSWAGLRPLIHEEGKSASELSRKDEIFESDSGLISIAGGKLTGYRKMAERIVDKVIKEYFSQLEKRCFTDSIPLTESNFKNYSEVKNYKGSLAIKLRVLNLEDFVGYLVHNYGKQCDAIMNRLSNNLEKDTELALLKAELWFGFEYEMVLKPADFLVRRTGLLYFNILRLRKYKEAILHEFKVQFGWTENQSVLEKEILEKVISESSGFLIEN